MSPIQPRSRYRPEPDPPSESTTLKEMALGQYSTITGFHRDEQQDWVAELSCGHTQHVRHRPPWMLRPWVIHEQGRKEHLGMTLLCKECAEET